MGSAEVQRDGTIRLEGLTVTVRQAQAELQNGRLSDQASKSATGVRSFSFSAELFDAVTHHRAQFAAPDRDGHVFVGPQGGQLRRSNFQTTGSRPGRLRGTGGLHFHDLRHMGTTVASTAGATSPDALAAQLLILHEGACIANSMHSVDEAARRAEQTAAILIKQALAR